MPKRLGIVPHLFARPLFDRLKNGKDAATARFEIVEEHFAQLATRLREGQLDGAFLSPVEYAGDYAHLRIVPGAAAVSEGESGCVLLIFNENLHHVNTIAVDPAFPSEIVLASLVIKEKYDTTPTIIPTSRPLDESLRTADAALAVDRAAILSRGHRSRIDLVDEWFDLTELPFVHGFWVMREGALTDTEVEAIVPSDNSPGGVRGIPHAEQAFLTKFRYAFDENAVSALNEFYRMAYYHGILKDIPDVKLIGRGKTV